MAKTFTILLFCCINIFAQTDIAIDRFLPGTEVMDICGDDANMWIATNGSGVFRYSPGKNKWINYSSDNKKLGQDFFYSIEANKKFVWAGSADGLFMLDKRRNRWSKRKFGKGGQLSNWVRSLLFDEKESTLWIGRFLYLTKYDLKKRRFYDYDLTMNKDIKTNTIKTIEMDGDSLIWFGTEAGLHKYDKSLDIESENSVTFYDNRMNYFEGLGDKVSISALFIEEDYLWIGLDEFITPENPEFNLGGLYRYDRKNEWLRFDTRSGLTGNGIYDLERTGNFLWVSTYQFSMSTKEQYGRGIAVINLLNNQVRQLTDERLPDTVFSLYFDGSAIWMGSDSGIYKIKLSGIFTNWE